MGAGVPRPVQPKSQTQRSATANPSTEGTTASHRQRALPAISTLKPSHCGKNQNHKAKNAVPTAREAMAVRARLPCPAAGAPEDCVNVVIFLALYRPLRRRRAEGLQIFCVAHL